MPTPQDLRDAENIAQWIADYAHAYGGMVTVNNRDLNASQLLDAVKRNPDEFVETRMLKDAAYLFFVVNGVPLAMQSTGLWEEATLRNLPPLTGISFGIGAEPLEPKFYFYPFTDKDRALRAKQSSLAAPADIFQTGAIMWQGQGRYDWQRPDQAVARFKKEGLQIRATNIIFDGDYHPQWLIDMAEKGMQDPVQYGPEFTQIMQDYIKAAVTRYRGKFTDWVLLNELLDDSGKLDQGNFWVRIIGPDVARIAIQDARMADPDISIIINDYPLMWNDSKTNGMVSFLEDLKEEGLLTEQDAVGIQAHDSVKNPKWSNLVTAKEEFKVTLRKFAQVGIHARITELDLFDAMEDDFATKQKKADIYRTIVEACLEINAEFGYPVVDSIATWGIKNDESWQYYVKGANFGYPLYFDRDFNPEPAYYEMMRAFYSGLATDE